VSAPKDLATEEDPCDLCGEDIDGNSGLFWDPEKLKAVFAHDQCGIDAGLNPA